MPKPINQQPTIRAINDHTRFGTGICVVYGADFAMRISRARMHLGIKEGKVITFNLGNGAARRTIGDWMPIPADAVIELD